MNHRLGTCSSCKAQYKVPASFQADRAKCKACGGVVAIGPVGGGAPAAAPKPEVKPAVKPAGAPAAAKPVPARPVQASAPKPMPKPVSEEKDSVRAAAAAAADRVRDAGRKNTAAETAAAVERKQGERSKSGSRSHAKSGSGRHGARKEQSKAPMLAAVLVLMVAGGGAAWFLTRGDDGGSQAAEKGAETAATEPQSATAEPAPEPLETASEPAPAADSPVAESAAADAVDSASEPAPAAKPADEDIDLTVFPDEPKLPGTSDADWASLQEWTAAFLDANSGAAGNRARGKLFERGREAFPALLNAMKRLDFSTDDGFRAGDLSQRFLMDVCNGQNFDWKYGTEPADVIFNKKVVRSWIKAWEQGRETPKAWAKLTKSTEEDAVKLFAVTGPFDAAGDPAAAGAGAASSLDDL